MISFQAVLGDDDHTSPDGAYVRSLRIRKWLYLASTGAFLLECRFYDATAASKVLAGVLKVPDWALALGLKFLLIYVGAQYLVLLLQLWTSRDEEWKRRFENRLSAEQSALRAKRRVVQSELKAVRQRETSAATAALKQKAAVEAALLEAQSVALNDQIMRIEKSNPADNRFYRYGEYAIDYMRLLLPLGLGGHALWQLLT